MKMNKRIKAEWVKALRSGDYKQGRGQLRTTDNSFCCLGVLCNTHAQQHPRIAAEQTRVDSYMTNQAVLPLQVQEWAKLDDYEATNLIHMNDNGKSFTEIADYIERNL